MAIAVVGVTAARILLVVHAVVGAVVVATCSHLVVWSYPYLRDRPARHRGVRRFAIIALSAYAVQFLLGNIIYPAYKVRVHMGVELGWVAKIFDLKEHWVALGLPLLVVAVVLTRRRRPGPEAPLWPRAVFYCALGAAVCAWAGALIGLLVSSIQSIGAPGTLSPAPPAAIVCDGELEEPLWLKAARTGAFLDENGTPSAPYSDARFLVQPDALYVALYAADEDIRAEDAFTVEIGGQILTYHPTDRGADVGVDMDGSLNDASDDDEEWVVEARIPYGGLPHGMTPVTLRRCDTLKSGVVKCSLARLRLELP